MATNASCTVSSATYWSLTSSHERRTSECQWAAYSAVRAESASHPPTWAPLCARSTTVNILTLV
jgi:hypothetical protein